MIFAGSPAAASIVTCEARTPSGGGIFRALKLRFSASATVLTKSEPRGGKKPGLSPSVGFAPGATPSEEERRRTMNLQSNT